MKRVFQQSGRSLYFMDTLATGITIINTVEGNKSTFTNRNYLPCRISLQTTEDHRTTQKQNLHQDSRKQAAPQLSHHPPQHRNHQRYFPT
jgi:hypothetical protein